MKESYRGQCNLHLHFAEQFLALLQQEGAEAWGGHYSRAMTETTVWQLQLAYRAHLADMLMQQPKFPQRLPEGDFYARHFKGDLPPEIIELADRERHSPWLQGLSHHRFLNHPSEPATPQPALIAREQDSQQLDRQTLREWLEELIAIIDRHRATLMEY